MTTSIMNFARRSAIHKQQPTTSGKRQSITPWDQSNSTNVQIDEGNLGFHADGDIVSFASSLQKKDGDRQRTIGIKITIPTLFKVDLTRKQFTARVKVVLIYSAELLANPESNLTTLFVNSIGKPLVLNVVKEVMAVQCGLGQRQCKYVYLQTLYEADFTISCAVKVTSKQGQTRLQKEFHSTVSDFPFDSHLCFVSTQLSPDNAYSEAFKDLTKTGIDMVFSEATNLKTLARPNYTDWLDYCVSPISTRQAEAESTSTTHAEAPILYDPKYVIQDFEVVSNEWQVLLPDDSFRCFGSGVSSRPKAQLRFHIMRKSEYYLWNGFALVFFVVSMTFPTIGIPSGNVADRLNFLVTIALTVIALKFSLSDKMPLSDRSNWLDTYINYGILTCLAMMIVVSTVGSMEAHEDDTAQQNADRSSFFLLCIVWCGYTLNLIYKIQRKFITHLDGEVLSEDGLGRRILLDYSEDILGRTKELTKDTMDKNDRSDEVTYDNPMLSSEKLMETHAAHNSPPISSTGDVGQRPPAPTEAQEAHTRPALSAFQNLFRPPSVKLTPPGAETLSPSDVIPLSRSTPLEMTLLHRDASSTRRNQLQHCSSMSFVGGEATTTEESLGTLEEGDEDEDEESRRAGPSGAAPPPSALPSSPPLPPFPAGASSHPETPGPALTTRF